MFCALNGATRIPFLLSQAQIAVVIQLLPALDEVPPTKIGLAVTAARGALGHRSHEIHEPHLVERIECEVRSVHTIGQLACATGRVWAGLRIDDEVRDT